MSCAYHSLNLTLCDMAHFCVKVVSFFWNCATHIFIIYKSTKRWKVLLDNVSDLIIKSLCNT